jgi:predicted nucleic acid-binding protein
MKQVRAPMLVCELVLTENCLLSPRRRSGDRSPVQLLEREAIRVSFDLSAHWPRIRTLMSRYRQMDLADASVVVMTELQAHSHVLTIDRRDFSVYRRNDRQVIDFVSPGRDKAS